jgi:hypothetical protein
MTRFHLTAPHSFAVTSFVALGTAEISISAFQKTDAAICCFTFQQSFVTCTINKTLPDGGSVMLDAYSTYCQG